MPAKQMPDDGGVFSTASIAALNNNATLEITTEGGQTINGALTLSGILTAAGATITGPVSSAPSVTAYSGTADAVLYPNAINVALFTGTGVDAATLGTPGSADAGKILVLVNANGSADTVTTAANKVVTGSSSAFDTLTSPAHSGAMAILVASNGFWNTNPLGVGAWTLSEV
ncbi:MAG: hypothetical protein WAK20_19965 [Candidatus Acidiferrum sp.]